MFIHDNGLKIAKNMMNFYYFININIMNSLISILKLFFIWFYIFFMNYVNDKDKFNIFVF